MKRSKGFQVLQNQKLLMQISGMWPETNPTPFYRFRFFMTTLGTTSVTLLLFLELLFVSDDYDKFSDVMALLISPTMYLVKHALFVINRKTFLRAVSEIDQETLTKYPDSLDGYMKSAVRTSTRLSTMFQVFCALVIFLYSLKPFFTERYELPFTVSFVELGVFIYPMHLWQSFGLFFAAWNNSCLDTMSMGFMAVGAAHFAILHDKLVHLRDWALPDHLKLDDDITEEKDKYIQNYVGECVQYHMAVLRLISSVEEALSMGFLGQFTNSIVVICNSGFQMAHSSPASLQFMTMMTYFFTMLVQLALYCWFGNELMLKSVEIRDACYMSDWTMCGPSVRRSLFIIMERTKRPFYLTAGKFATLSLTSYMAIIKSSYSYFALMQKLYDKDLNGN